MKKSYEKPKINIEAFKSEEIMNTVSSDGYSLGTSMQSFELKKTSNYY